MSGTVGPAIGTQIDRDTFADRAAGKRERLGIDRSRDIRRQPFKRDRYRTCYARVADHPIVARDAAARALRIATGKVDIRRSEYAQLRCGCDNNCMAARRRPGAGGGRSGKDDQPRFRRRTGIRLQTQGDARAERGIGIDASGYARRQLAERKPDGAARSADTHDGDGNIRRRTPLDQRLTQRTCKKEIGLSAGCLLESNVAHGNSGQQCGIVDRLEHHRGDSRLGDGKIEGRVKTSPCRHVRDCRRYCHAASVQSRQAQVLLDSDPCNRQQANMQAYAALQCGKCDPRPTAAKLAARRIVETGDMPARRVDHDSTNDPAIFQERYARQLIIEPGAHRQPRKVFGHDVPPRQPQKCAARSIQIYAAKHPHTIPTHMRLWRMRLCRGTCGYAVSGGMNQLSNREMGEQAQQD